MKSLIKYLKSGRPQNENKRGNTLKMIRSTYDEYGGGVDGGGFYTSYKEDDFMILWNCFVGANWYFRVPISEIELINQHFVESDEQTAINLHGFDDRKRAEIKDGEHITVPYIGYEEESDFPSSISDLRECENVKILSTSDSKATILLDGHKLSLECVLYSTSFGKSYHWELLN